MINEALSPNVTDIDWATALLTDLESRGGVRRDGSELPDLARARRIYELAQAFAS